MEGFVSRLSAPMNFEDFVSEKMTNMSPEQAQRWSKETRERDYQDYLTSFYGAKAIAQAGSMW